MNEVGCNLLYKLATTLWEVFAGLLRPIRRVALLINHFDRPTPRFDHLIPISVLYRLPGIASSDYLGGPYIGPARCQGLLLESMEAREGMPGFAFEALYNYCKTEAGFFAFGDCVKLLASTE